MKNLIISRGARVALIGVILLAMVGWGTSVLAITWGEYDMDGKYPNVGAFMIQRTSNGEVVPLCSGTLVHEQVFLTAGHCIERAKELIDLELFTDVYVSFDFDVGLDSDPTLLKVADFISHPDYFWGGSDPHDVGLLILEAPAPDAITPAKLPDEGFLDGLKQDGVLREGEPDGAKFIVVGYGGMLDYWWHGNEPLEGYEGEPPAGLGEEQEHIVYEDQRRFGESEYVALVPVWLHMNQNHIQDNQGTCFGDSGGPAFWEEDDGTLVLVGITSWGDGMCVVTGFDYRIDIPDALGFIWGTIEGLE